jgi:hypothetical protein
LENFITLTTQLNYLNTLPLSKKENWNSEIDSMAASFGILISESIELAKTNIKQAALNRTVFRYLSENKMAEDVN